MVLLLVLFRLISLVVALTSMIKDVYKIKKKKEKDK